MDRRVRSILVTLLALGALLALHRLGLLPTDGGGATRGPEAPAGAPGALPSTGGIPGGSLRAHEGLSGGHTLARHVGQTEADLRRRADAERKREVSTFPDEASAERAVAAVLSRRRGLVDAWLRKPPSGLQDFSATLDAPVGTVWRADRGRAQPGRTVVVVLSPSSRFPEGFRIHTAYVTLP